MHHVVDGLLAMLEILGSAFMTNSTMTKALLFVAWGKKSVVLHPVHVCLLHPLLRFPVFSEFEMQSISRQDSHCKVLPLLSLLDH